MDSCKKRQRCAGFSTEEKMFKANICAKYKNILENKKTDQIANEEKLKTWDKIASEVNAAAVNSIYRSRDVIKRFYENRKREVRKLAAEEKKELFVTGGGPCATIKKDACHGIILSVTNNKTVYGLENELGGDIEPPVTLMDLNTSNIQSEFENTLSDVEIIYEATTSKTVGDDQDLMTWKKYVPADLKKPASTNLLTENRSEQSISKRKNDEEPLNTPHRKKMLPSRRRPTVEIKSLTRSDLAEKYNELMDVRMEIAEFHRRKLQEELLIIEEEKKLRFQLLELQIEVERAKLKKLTE